MTSAPHIVALLSMFALAASCASDDIPGPPVGLPYAAATPACGPADGPAVAIYLAPNPLASLEPSAPFVRIAIWQPLERLTEQPWALDEGAAMAAYVSTQSAFEGATDGSVTVSAVDADSTVRGWATLTFPTRGTVRGGFHAPWVRGAALRCG